MGGGSETMIVEKNLQFAEAYQHHGYRMSKTANTMTAGANSSVRGDTSFVIENNVVCFDDVVKNEDGGYWGRLTPLECERLDGFPDNWTEYGASGKEMSDKTRYEALGNSIAVPCADRVFAGIIAAEKNGGQDNE